jgi:phospholipase/carboxylesterase
MNSTAALEPPVVVTSGSSQPDAPLVVLLHGRGSDEQSTIGLADLLPHGPAYAALRAPIAEGEVSRGSPTAASAGPSPIA